ncbi:HAMP domain-containing histidine kinase [Sulfurimonas lithotrophica]|uniref:histidine kinase n=2 Tax=Sulfurimonas lithotrophica TaxID=2590022 RepID=A0A5P8P413_9BACT|nr:HAMP domain-containing histidine kinase [Sulfurimonas lithotrophica]
MKKKNSITIKQADFFTIFIVFIFTVIFAFLLIEENYFDYERTLLKELSISGENLNEEQMQKYHETKKELKRIFIKNTIAIATLAFILFTIVLGLYKILNYLLQRDLQVFLKFFKETAHKDYVLNPHTIFFKDFKIMVGYANNMVDTISEQKRILKDLNQNLEDRVKKKTINLQETNKKLLQEKEFSEEILDAQKKFLRYTVHETNTPLSVILTSIELYTMKHPKDKHLSKIEAAVKNIFSIYDDLSYLVKKDQVEYPKSMINFGDYISYRIDFFKDVATMSKVSFDYNVPEENLHIYFNKTKLQRIVDNTITNAIKYTLAGEIIDVNLKQFGSNIEFSMSSKSKAIKEIDKVFEAYYREEKNREGFGLGLQMVRNICDEEGVEIKVSSDENKTSFTYVFKMIGE